MDLPVFSIQILLFSLEIVIPSGVFTLCNFVVVLADFKLILHTIGLISGLAHLEALEILSNQSEKKVNTLLMSLSPDIMAALKPQLLEIRTNFEIGEDEEEDVDEHDFTELLSDIFGKLDIGTSPDKLTRVCCSSLPP